jgi:hypothetical protein
VLGNYEGPHHYDVPPADIIDIVFQGRPTAIVFEAANPRHAHEWTHPELVAQRINSWLIAFILVGTRSWSAAKTSWRAPTAVWHVGRPGGSRARRRVGEDGQNGRGRPPRLTRALELAEEF